MQVPLRAWILLAAVLAAPSRAGDLAYRKEGRGGVVVLLHDLGGNRSVWAGLIDHQKSNFTFVAVELPGHGASPAPPMKEGAVDLPAVAADLAALVHKLKLGRPLLVGHGLGALVAARAALAEPGLARGVLLLDGGLAALPAERAARLDKELGQDPAGALNAFFGAQSSGAPQTAVLLKEAQKVPSGVLQAYVRGWARESVPATGPRVPMQLFASAKLVPDPAQEKEALERLGLAGAPKFSVQYLVNSGHWIMLDEPPTFEVLLNDFDTATLSGE